MIVENREAMSRSRQADLVKEWDAATKTSRRSADEKISKDLGKF